MDCRTNGRVSVLAILALLGVAASCPGQTSRAAAGHPGVTSQTVSLGSLVPDGTGTNAAGMIPFRFTVPRNIATAGYGLRAVVGFTFTPAARNPGGQSIAASDIGIGVAGVFSATGALPAALLIPGFAGTGAVNGQATLADLLSGREILRIGKSPALSIPAGGSDLQVTLKIAVPRKYFTPGTFSGNLTVTVVP